MDRSSKQKIDKETQVLKDTLDEKDVIDILGTFHPNAEKYTFLSSARETFSRIDQILGHKSNLSIFKKTEIISSIISQYYETRYELQRKNCKEHKHMEIKQHVSKWPTDYWRNQNKNQRISETNDNENTTTQNLWDAAKAILRGKFIAIHSYLHKQEKHRRDNLTLHLKQLEKEEQKFF